MKMYIAVRRDLDKVYRMVQGAHALAGYTLKHTLKANEWNNNTLVFLEVPDEWSLIKLGRRLEDKGKTFAEFYEPDIGNQLTAIACLDSGEVFKHYSLAQ